MEHSFTYEKGRVTVTGVKKLDAFEEREVRVALDSGLLVVKGSGFELVEMAQTSGRVAFLGTVSSASYAGTAEKGSLLKKLFK